MIPKVTRFSVNCFPSRIPFSAVNPDNVKAAKAAPNPFKAIKPITVRTIGTMMMAFSFNNNKIGKRILRIFRRRGSVIKKKEIHNELRITN